MCCLRRGGWSSTHTITHTKLKRSGASAAGEHRESAAQPRQTRFPCLRRAAVPLPPLPCRRAGAGLRVGDRAKCCRERYGTESAAVQGCLRGARPPPLPRATHEKRDDVERKRRASHVGEDVLAQRCIRWGRRRDGGEDKHTRSSTAEKTARKARARALVQASLDVEDAEEVDREEREPKRNGVGALLHCGLSSQTRTLTQAHTHAQTRAQTVRAGKGGREGEQEAGTAVVNGGSPKTEVCTREEKRASAHTHTEMGVHVRTGAATRKEMGREGWGIISVPCQPASVLMRLRARGSVARRGSSRGPDFAEATRRLGGGGGGYLTEHEGSDRGRAGVH